MKKLILSSFAAAFFLQVKAQTFTHAPVVVTGFTADVIADGTGPAAGSVTADVDGGSYNFVAQNFKNPSNQSPTTFLPANGTINSAVTPGLPFQLQPYSGTNSLRLTTISNSGTLTFSSPRSADKLTVLVTTAYPSTFTATVNFTDATSQAFTGNAIPNWFDGASPAIQGISRVQTVTNNIENSTTNPRMYQYALVLSGANAAKTIQSVTFTKTTTGVSEILHVFAVTASTLLPVDIGVSAITAPTAPIAPGPSMPVMVTVKNFGSSPLASATLGFSVDGITVVNNYAFTASPALATNGVSAPVNIGNFSFPTGTRKIKAWTSQPNGLADGAKTNDTLLVSLISCAALSGNYTIDKNNNGSATNFQSFTSVMQVLNTCGVSGPVTITVAPNSGPYNEQVLLSAINGTSATNTITFEGGGNTVTASPGTTHQGVFTLDGADFIRINNFTLALNPTAATGYGIQLKNNANNNIISNNTINLPLTSSLSSVNGIVAGTSPTATGNNTSNTLIQNNIINGGYYGIAINGNTGNLGAVANQIIGNQIKDSYLTGLYLNNVTTTVVENNDISRPARINATTFNGLYLVGISTGNQIRKNRVHNTHDVATTKTYTVYGYYSTSAGAAGAENVFANNLAYNLNNTGGTLYVFYNSGANHTWYFNNSVSAADQVVSYATLRGMWFQNQVNNVKFINNNFSLASPGATKHVLYVASTATALVSNNNNLYKGASGSVGYYAADKSTLTDWQAVNTNAYDQASVSTNPFFLNVATGNLQPNAGILNNIGQPQTAVTDDITGATRNATTPDPGAYEFTPPTADAGITAILSPNSGCGLTNQETVSVTLNNFGSLPQSNIPVSYILNGGPPVTEIFAGPLAPGTSVTYDFTAKANLSVPNIYSLVAQTALTGDGLPSNDASSKLINAIPLVTTYPYSENFETYNGGWLAGGTVSSWAWGTPAKAVINSAASGTKAYITGLTAQYNSNERSQVTGPCFNFSSLTAPIFEMKAWWNSEFSADGAVLQSSIDGGATWQNVGLKGDPNNWYNDNAINGGPGGQPIASAQGWTGRNSTSNGSGGWVTVKHALSGLGGQSNVKLRVAFGADGSVFDDGFAFDDVQIYETPTNDGGVIAITSPNSGCGLSNQETVSITVKNFGSAALATIPVAFTVDGGVAVNEVAPGPLAPNATMTYTFLGKANLSAAGLHTLVAKTKITGDNIAANDSIIKTITTIPTISTLPYTEGFENGNGGWIAGGVLSSWALGTPAKPVINSAAAGTKAWVTGLTTNYFASEKSYVVGPCFNFSGMADPDFSMKVWWNSEFSYDGAVLQSSIDGGATWQKIGFKGEPNNWYNDNSISGAPGNQPAATAEGWTGRNLTTNGSNGWVTVKHRLTGLGGQASVLLRVAFGADGSNQDNGFAFDEIRIIDNSNNLAVNSVVPISKLCGFTSAEIISAVIENAGAAAVSGFTVSYTVNGGTPVTETYSGSLAGGTNTTFTFAQTANLSASGSYTIVVTVTMAGDPDAANNTATYTITNSSFSGLPPVFDFEPGGNGVAQLRTVTKTRSAILESTDASFGATSTKGMIMDGVGHTSWVLPVGIVDPWTSNPQNFSAAYICFDPSGGAATDSLWLTFDLKQLFNTANANTNLRITANGVQVGPTYRPPFSGTPIGWTPVKVDLFAYKNQSGLQVAIESSVREAFANGAGTANLIDNIQIRRRVANPNTGLRNDVLARRIHVFPNPSNAIFHIDLPAGKTYQLEVTDLTGKVLKKQTGLAGSNKLDLEGSAKGIYLLKVTSEGSTAVRKLIVE